MFNKKDERTLIINEIKDINSKNIDLFKEIKKEAKENRISEVLTDMNSMTIDIDYKSMFIKNATIDQLNDMRNITELIEKAFIDTQELLRKGTVYGVQLSLDRIKIMLRDRSTGTSAFFIDQYVNFEKNVWNLSRLRELAYGEITRLKEKQDKITRTALMEKDSMMRVRFFEDIKLLESEILHLETEAHEYNAYQNALRNEKSLKKIIAKTAISEEDKVPFDEFTNVVKRLSTVKETKED